MKTKKIIILLLPLILFSCLFSYSNEKNIETKIKKASFSFNFLKGYSTHGLTQNENPDIKSNIQLYGLSNSQTIKLGLAMGIAGSIMAGTGILCIIPGSILMWGSWAYYNAPYGIQRTPPSDPGYHMWFAGIGLLASGITLFVLGVPLAIIGFILYYNNGRLATLIESNKNETRLGFVVKL